MLIQVLLMQAVAFKMPLLLLMVEQAAGSDAKSQFPPGSLSLPERPVLLPEYPHNVGQPGPWWRGTAGVKSQQARINHVQHVQ